MKPINEIIEQLKKYTYNPASWMHDHLKLIGDSPLNEICITGSHDSGMSMRTGGTPFASDCNTLTQTNALYGQLSLGTRYFDIRPIIAKGEYFTGHYQDIDVRDIAKEKIQELPHDLLQKLPKKSWQGANGQSIASIIEDVNNFTADYNELVILNLSHSVNTDKKNSEYETFNNAEWEDLFDQLSELKHRFSADPSTKLQTLSVNSFIANGPAVLIICEQGGDAIQDKYLGNGFFKKNDKDNDIFKPVNKYSGTNDVDKMAKDQFDKMRKYSSDYFLLSWTLTQSYFQILGCNIGIAPSIKTQAAKANAQLSERVMKEVQGPSYPNIIYTDNIISNEASRVAMWLNCKRSGNDEIPLSWTPIEFSIPGVGNSSLRLTVNYDGTFSLSGSGTFSINLTSVSIPIPDGWQGGLGLGEFTCNLNLSGSVSLSTSNNKTTASLSKLTGSTMDLDFILPDFTFDIDIDDLKDLSTAIKSQIENGNTNFFNAFWSQLIKTPINNTSEKAEMIFNNLTLDVSNPIIAVQGCQKLSTENSTLRGSFSCTWTSSGCKLSLNASVEVLGKKTSVTKTSKSTNDLIAITKWIKEQVTPLYNNYNHAWLQEVGTWLRSLKKDVAQVFKDSNYTASDAIIAVDHAHQSGAALDAKLLKAGGYSTADIAIALKQGLNQSASEFVEALKEGLGETDAMASDLFFVAGYDYKTIGDYLKNAGCDTGYIASLFKNNGQSAEEVLSVCFGLEPDYASMGRSLHAAGYNIKQMINGIKARFGVTDIEAANASIPGGYTPSEIGQFLKGKPCSYDQKAIAKFYRQHGDNGVNALRAVNDAYGKGSDDCCDALYNAGYSGAEIANAFRDAFGHSGAEPGTYHNIGETLRKKGFGRGNLDGLSGEFQAAIKGYLPEGKKPRKGVSLPKPDTHPKGLKKPGV